MQKKQVIEMKTDPALLTLTIRGLETASRDNFKW